MYYFYSIILFCHSELLYYIMLRLRSDALSAAGSIMHAKVNTATVQLRAYIIITVDISFSVVSFQNKFRRYQPFRFPRPY